ncbi:HNH endonuclease [Clostridium sp.]|uniref:HNH endonuclease n=1 Tax=Clostridium sp. TaxID=1506 RepID=UPI00260399C3|nr:HNH endonuclease [Clostridium sp.]
MKNNEKVSKIDDNKDDKDDIIEEVKAHTDIIEIDEVIEYPAHVPRTESSMFRKTKKKLKKDNNFKCWITGRSDKEAKLQVHHILEWSFCEKLSKDAMIETLKCFHFYEGYNDDFSDTKDMTREDLIDSYHNVIVLSQEFHTGKLTGIHFLPFPVWVSNKAVEKGQEIVPTTDKEKEEFEKEIDERELKEAEKLVEKEEKHKK